MTRTSATRVGTTVRTLWTAAALMTLVGSSMSAAWGQQADPPKPAATKEAPADAQDDASGEPITLKNGLKTLKRIRLKNFGTMRNVEIRQAGLAKLREFTDPKFYPHLLELYAREQHDVRSAVMDIFVNDKSDQGDASLAYGAVFDKDPWFRDECTKRLVKRLAAIRAERAEAKAKAALASQKPASGPRPAELPEGLDCGASWRVKAIIKNGLMQKDDTLAAAAAKLAEDLKVFDLIPSMVNAQVQTPQNTAVGGGPGGDDSALAYIEVADQQAYVSDLTPVVGDSAVAFDPTISVVTSGTIFRVIDASVVTYRTEIHYSLQRLAKTGWNGSGTNPDSLGWDNKKWLKWYADEFVPSRRDVATDAPATTPSAPAIPAPSKPK